MGTCNIYTVVITRMRVTSLLFGSKKGKPTPITPSREPPRGLKIKGLLITIYEKKGKFPKHFFNQPTYGKMFVCQSVCLSISLSMSVSLVFCIALPYILLMCLASTLL